MSDLVEFLAPFAAADREQILALTEAAPKAATVLMTDPLVRELRRAPLKGLQLVSDTLGGLWRSAEPPGRIAWCTASSGSAGLEELELETVLGRHMHLDCWYRAREADGQRLVAVGTLREENLALCFRLAEDVTAGSLGPIMDALFSAPAPIAVVLVNPSSAARLLQDAAAVALFRRWRETTRGRLGAWIDDTVTADALRDPADALGALRVLAGDIRCVRFANPGRLNARDLDRFMRCAGLVCDMSLSIDDGAAPEGDVNRRAAYHGSAPYQPQPFDLRSPWALATGDGWFETPMTPVDASSLGRWWSIRFAPADADLAPLLDAARIEAFLRLMTIDPNQERVYHDYRVYNPPPPGPPRRIAVLDGGEARPERVWALTNAVSALVSSAGQRARVVGHDDFLSLAREEITARYAISGSASIALQEVAHEYLEQIPLGGPLRSDYADFAAFLPGRLGDVLELGSGYGELAWALASRGRRYVRLDLQSKMFATLRRDLAQSAVLADMHRLPFVDGCFDSIVANNVLEHLYDPRAGLREIRRVMRPAGRLFTLIPLDALDSRYQLKAHHWKVDASGIELALKTSGYEVERLEIVDLYELGVGGAFPSCHGLAAKVEARREDAEAAVTTEDAEVVSRISIARTGLIRSDARIHLSGRLLPSIRELVGFERWEGRRVVVLGADNRADGDEFARYGALTTVVDSARWDAVEGSVDLVYSFLGIDPSDAARASRVIHRALAPGGTFVAAFRHAAGLHHLARIRSYFGGVCELSQFGSDALVEYAEDDGIPRPDAYVEKAALVDAFGALSTLSVTTAHLTPDTLPEFDALAYPPEFWLWLARTFGRFLVLKAVK